MMTGAFSRNVGKLFFELKLVTDNLLFIYVTWCCVIYVNIGGKNGTEGSGGFRYGAL